LSLSEVRFCKFCKFSAKNSYSYSSNLKSLLYKIFSIINDILKYLKIKNPSKLSSNDVILLKFSKIYIIVLAFSIFPFCL